MTHFNPSMRAALREAGFSPDLGADWMPAASQTDFIYVGVATNQPIHCWDRRKERRLNRKQRKAILKNYARRQQ